MYGLVAAERQKISVFYSTFSKVARVKIYLPPSAIYIPLHPRRPNTGPGVGYKYLAMRHNVDIVV